MTRVHKIVLIFLVVLKNCDSLDLAYGKEALNGNHLTVSANDFAPYSFTKTNKELSGSHIQLLQSAASKYNFTYSITISKKKSTGIRRLNCSWTGLMHDITDGNYDIALVMAATRERFKVVDFTTQIGVDHLIFVSTLPKKSFSNVALLTPYQNTVWVFIFMAFFLASASFYLIMTMDGEYKAGLIHVILWTVALSMEQSISIQKNLKSLVLIWLGFGLIIGTGYKCNLASFLATPTIEKKPTTFPDLVDASDYKIYFDISGIAGYDHFRSSDKPLVKHLKKRMILTSSSSDCVIYSFRDRESVCIGWDISLPIAIARNLSISSGKDETMYKTQEPLLFTYVSMALRKNSPFTSMFNFIGASYLETGMIQKWTDDAIGHFQRAGKKWTEKLRDTEFYQTLKSSHHDMEEKALNFHHFATLFMSFLAASGIASCVFFWEILNK